MQIFGEEVTGVKLSATRGTADRLRLVSDMKFAESI